MVVRALALIGTVVLLAPAAAQASANAVVESTGGGVTGSPSPQHSNETLADAVAYVEQQGGGAITFAPALTGQTITLTTGLTDINAPTTITGPSGGTITISGGGATRQLLTVGTSGNLTVSDLTLTGVNNTTTGGAIVTEGQLTVDDVKISGNASGAGAGICQCGSPLTYATTTVDNSTLTGNTGGDGGGAIFSEGGMVTVNYSTVSNNEGGEGGGIYAQTASIFGSTFSGNSAAVGGGGAFSVGTLTISDSTFSGNNATGDGTEGAGGAILSSEGATALTITSSTIVGNTAAGTTGVPAGGGGIYADAANAAEPVSLIDTVVAGNSANEGPDVLSVGAFPQTSVRFSLIGNPADAGIVGSTATDLLGTSATPLAPKLGPLQSNGGPTQTMLPLAGSPVIDAGQAVSGVSSDQRQKPRTVKLGFPEPPGGDGTDIGAVELQDTEVGPPTVTGVSPNHGDTGATVTITGANLFPAMTVMFGATPATSVTAESATQITATVPPGVGAVNVRVIAPAGESAVSGSDRFTYQTPFPTTIFGNQRLTLTAPAASLCTAHTGKLRVGFTTSAVKGSKKTKLKFTRAAFYIDKGVKHTKKESRRVDGRRKTVTVTTYGPNAIGKKTPVSASISLRSVKTGRHVLKVVAAYTEPVKRGKKTRTVTVTKTVRTEIAVC